MKTTRPPPDQRRCAPQRGAAAIIALFSLLLIGAFIALSFNTGNLMSVRSQLQNAVDAAALAGAKSLDTTLAGQLEARISAQYFAGQHGANEWPVAVDLNESNDSSGDIVLGSWDFAQPDKRLAFLPADGATPLRLINAILVHTGRETRRSSELPVYFSPFLGRESVDVTAEAVAVGGGPCSGCAVPFVFADCLIVKPDGELDCGRVLQFTNAIEDNMALTNLSPGDPTVNPNVVIDILGNECSQVSVGDNIGVQNGNDLTPSVIVALERYIATYGPKVTAPIVHPDTCPDPQFNRLQPVVGMATFTITQVLGPPTQPQREITIMLECEESLPDPAVAAGCGFFGTTSPQTRLVR